MMYDGVDLYTCYIDVQMEEGTQLMALRELSFTQGLALPGMWREWTRIE